MSGEEFVRHDVQVAAWQSRTGGADIHLDGVPPVYLTPASLRAWRAGESIPPPLRPRGRVARHLARATASSAPAVMDPLRATLVRVTLDLHGPKVISLPWEAALYASVRSAAIVRVSPSRPRVLDMSLTFPLRMLRLDSVLPGSPVPTHALEQMIQRIMPADSDDAVVVGRTPVVQMEEFLGLQAWPTVEVIELAGSILAPVEASRAGAPRGLLSTAQPDGIGTLGWFERIAAGRQVRLLVVDCQTAAEAAAARLLAAELTARGGAAVVVADRVSPYALFSLYIRIIHDQPLDMAAGTVAPGLGLTVGRHGEEALRISRVVTDLYDLSKRLIDPGDDAGVRALRRTLERADRLADFDTLAQTLPDFSYESARYDMESGGFVPVSRHLAWVRSMSRIGRIGTGGRVVDPPLTRIREAPTPGTPPRFFNVGLHTEEESPQLVAPTGHSLLRARPYLLGVNVGPQDPDRTPTGALALVEEVFAWEPGQQGAWAEVAVVGIDFDVVGEPVQQLWVPRYEPSQQIFFTVVPRRAGASALRVCLYVGTNIVQSVRLAALVDDATGEQEPDPAELARLLDLSEHDVADASWRTRLEYATRNLSDMAAPSNDRALSLVVNDLVGRSVVTVKGQDLLLTEVRTDADLPKLVTDVRQALEDLSTPPAEPGVLEEHRSYGYGVGEDSNAGKPERFDVDLVRLAEVGWNLFDAVVPGDKQSRERIAELLDLDPRPIHIAHVYLHNVIPWAAAYDRVYEPPQRRRRSGGQPVAHGTCPAGLPGPDGQMPPGRCGELPGCLLAGPEEERRSLAQATGAPLYIESTVVCARRFWGFRHQIELPVQQVTTTGATIPEAARDLRGSPMLQMVVGMNAGLPNAAKHLDWLKKTVTTTSRMAEIVAEAYDADDVKDSLKAVDLDIVYLYCHADGGVGTGIEPPILRFQMEGDDERSLQAADLHADAWLHRPLIVLNGCRTAAFRPDALSPFLRKLVQDRMAGALLGTEISVWEQLATEVGAKFLHAFLDGQTAGAALLKIRQDLLARRNPLGLAYTLYADVNFALATPDRPDPLYLVGVEPVTSTPASEPALASNQAQVIALA
ncbi:hypothetical protein [Phytohabitans aurantiacus]|uniref:CHAT domain-containing protein n=1 Tax=Phytohabitans aurantiacus TaxID=3016789 RepID=A0ABQ5QZE3_9ACTN|nr:hypothetical protein [Phytohabitans aurantiacus]GLH99804.1 hypothetical protein Pa4123_50810 [Phytohabitans aurantiacus]